MSLLLVGVGPAAIVCGVIVAALVGGLVFSRVGPAAPRENGGPIPGSRGPVESGRGAAGRARGPRSLEYLEAFDRDGPGDNWGAW